MHYITIVIEDPNVENSFMVEWHGSCNYMQEYEGTRLDLSQEFYMKEIHDLKNTSSFLAGRCVWLIWKLLGTLLISGIRLLKYWNKILLRYIF